MKSSAHSLTEGTIVKSVLFFSFPIFIGNLFQQLYSIADSIIVGNFSGSIALAAVSGTGTIIYLFIGFFSGMYQGMGVIIARFFGAKDRNNVKKSIDSALLFGLVSGVFISLIGVLSAGIIVSLVGTPNDVIQDSVTYLQIYFSGSIFLAFYNTTCGIYRALGDSKRPLYYLCISSITNIVLDFLFVGYYDMGVVGAGLATVIAQGVSALLSLHRLFHLDDGYAFTKKNFTFSGSILIQMLKIGLPSGIQNSIIGFANVFVQANINAFGTIVMAGAGAYTRLHGLAFLPIESLSMGMTTYISQNIGAQKLERVKKGATFGIILACCSAEFFGILIFFNAATLMSLFSTDVDIIQIGVLKARIDSLFYGVMAYSHIVSSIMRGAGSSITPMVIILSSWCLLRLIYIKFTMYFFNNIILLFTAYPVTWIVSFIFFFIFYRQLTNQLKY